jgi:hypothetical protein
MLLSIWARRSLNFRSFLGPSKEIDWLDFYEEAIELKGRPAGEIVVEGREERF